LKSGKKKAGDICVAKQQILTNTCQTEKALFPTATEIAQRL
jgi:hypothetical protein